MAIGKNKKIHRISRHKRVRAKLFGTAQRPRISIFKSNRHIFAQVIDDDKGKTIVSGSDVDLNQKASKVKKTESALRVGETLAAQILEKGIKAAVFDRGGFKYHGRIKALADGLQKSGIKI